MPETSRNSEREVKSSHEASPSKSTRDVGRKRERDGDESSARRERETGSKPEAGGSEASMTRSTAASVTSSSVVIDHVDQMMVNNNDESGVADRAENEATPTLRIDNFRRPFTLNAVKAFVQQCGKTVADGFWINSIKTHCYVTYETVDVAQRTMEAIDGKVWPPETGQALAVSFSVATAAEISSGGGAPGASAKHLTATPIAAGQRRSNAKPATSIDSFFLKTQAKPALYYLPVSDAEVAARKKQRSESNQ